MKSIHFYISAFTAALFCSTMSFAQDHPAKDTSIDIKVTGIICSMDLPLIKDRVKKEPGVIDCNATSKPGAMTQFRITYYSGQISYQKVIEAVEDAPSCEDPKDRPYRVKGKH